MVLVVALGFMFLPHQEPGGFSHTPAVTDTVRYNRDEFGVRLHVPAGWSGRPVLIYLGPKGAIRSAPTVKIDAQSFRGRLPASGELQYVFWVDPGKFKPGSTGMFVDKTGLTTTSAPAWFTQASTQYPEAKPPHWPGEGAVFYALDSDRFGDGTFQEKGAQSFTKHIDYVQGLGVNSIWIDPVRPDSGDVVEDAHHADWHVVAETSQPPKGADGVAADNPADLKGWRVALAANDAHALIQAGQANGVLDSRWTGLIYDFIRSTSTLSSSLASGLVTLRSDYPDAVADQMVLRLGGPKKPRPSAVLKGDPKRLQQLWLLLLTLPGVPIIDSGDEIGLLDSDSAMQWDPTRQNPTILDTVKRLILAHTSRPSLFRGDFQILDLGDDNHTFGFARTDRRETTIVLLNNSDEFQHVQVPVAAYGSAELRDLFGGTTFGVFGTTVSMSLVPHGFALIGN